MPLLSSPVIARSRLSTGNLARLDRVFAKAKNGEPITIGFIGGSITHGEGASRPGFAFASLVTDWWTGNFPKSKITLVNAGVNGTGSGYGCLRVQRDLLSHHPDFVIVEFGVNDHDDLAHAETYEGVVRQILADPDHPAVLLLFMMHHDGTGAEPLESEVGRQYQLPMISYRDALWPEIAAGRLKWSDVTADAIHPNDRGHAAVAEFINSFLQDALEHSSLDHPPALTSAPLPPPRFTGLFGATRMINAEDLEPTECDGWELDRSAHCWTTATPGSVIEFEVTGSLIDLMYARVSPAGGTASITVDDGPATLCDGWFDGTWAGFCQVDLVGRELSPGMHRVRIELVEEKNSLSTGHEFRILGLATAGAKP